MSPPAQDPVRIRLMLGSWAQDLYILPDPDWILDLSAGVAPGGLRTSFPCSPANKPGHDEPRSRPGVMITDAVPAALTPAIWRGDAQPTEPAPPCKRTPIRHVSHPHTREEPDCD